MAKSLIENPELTKFTLLYAVRRADGARIAAKRVAIDENTPIRWTIVVTDKLEKYIFDEQLPMFEDNAEGRVQKQYSTSELSEQAQKAGFEDWQQAPLALVEAWEIVGNEDRKRLIPQYELPDGTLYPID